MLNETYKFEVMDMFDRYFVVEYHNTRVQSIAKKPFKLLIDKEEVEYQAKDRGILKELGGFVEWGDGEKACELHFDDFCSYSEYSEKFEELLITLAKEQLNVNCPSKVEKLEQGYDKLRTELDESRIETLRYMMRAHHFDHVKSLFNEVQPSCNLVKYEQVIPSKA